MYLASFDNFENILNRLYRYQPLPNSGYKDSKPEHKDQRQRIIAGIEQKIAIGDNYDRMANNADALDAVLCILAGMDFLDCRALPPKDLALAKREGWIWVRGK